MLKDEIWKNQLRKKKLELTRLTQQTRDLDNNIEITW
jgi:transposase